MTVCVVCKKEFQATIRAPEKQTCSSTCYKTHRRQQWTEDVAKGKYLGEPNRICGYCKAPYVQPPFLKTTKFCSKTCAARSVGNRNVKPLVDYICLSCGGVFQAHSKQKPKFCSSICHSHYRSLHWVGHLHSPETHRKSTVSKSES